MSYLKDEELLDWNMTLDENFEEDVDDIAAIGDDESDDLGSPTSRENWVRFSTEDGLNLAQSRRAGDGTSLNSETFDDPKPYHDDEKEVETESKQGRPPHSPSQQTYNGSQPYLPTDGQSETAKFQILDDDYDISPMADVPPMEFRGSLKTDADSYGRGSSCMCKYLRYLLVALVAFALGVLLGYGVAVERSSANEILVPNVIASTRAFSNTHNTTTVAVPGFATKAEAAKNLISQTVAGNNGEQVL